MIARIEMFGRAPFNRSRDRALGLRWQCRECLVQIRLNQAAYLYVVNVRGSTFLLTFGAGALDADVRHALVHTCGVDVDAVPLWRRPEWS